MRRPVAGLRSGESLWGIADWVYGDGQRWATAHELSFTNRRRATVDQLDAVIKDLVNAYHRCDLPKVWGTGNSASADGTKYDLAENSLLAEYSIRYGAYGGIAYHHVADTYIALFSHFIPCGVWEAVYILEGQLVDGVC